MRQSGIRISSCIYSYMLLQMPQLQYSALSLPRKVRKNPTSRQSLPPAEGARPDRQPGLYRDQGGCLVQGQDQRPEPAVADRFHLPEGDWLGLVLAPLSTCLYFFFLGKGS